jgi:hypothetical protein
MRVVDKNESLDAIGDPFKTAGYRYDAFNSGLDGRYRDPEG